MDATPRTGRLWLALLLTSLLTGVPHAAEQRSAEPGSAEEDARSHNWIVEHQEGLSNVSLIGDSISIGYQLGRRGDSRGSSRPFIRPIGVHRETSPL